MFAALCPSSALLGFYDLWHCTDRVLAGADLEVVLAHQQHPAHQVGGRDALGPRALLPH